MDSKIIHIPGFEREILAVGDVHGEACRLERLLDFAFQQTNRVVFLGDYVNRGPSSKEVLDLLVDAKAQRADWVFLIGNHDAAFLDWIDGKVSTRTLIPLGFASTLKSYGFTEANLDQKNMVPASHVNFLRDLKWFVETDDTVFSHAGLDPDEPKRRTLSIAITSHPTLLTDSLCLEKRVVCGHYVQQNSLPHFIENLMYLDTGCGMGGPLTVVNTKTQMIGQF